MFRFFRSKKTKRIPRAAFEPMERRTLLATIAVFHYDTAPNELRVTFDSNVQSQLQAADLRLENVTYDLPVTPSLVSYDEQTNIATFRFPDAQQTGTNKLGVLRNGWYRAVISQEDVPLSSDFIFDFSMRNGDADGNGTINGDDYGLIDQGFLGGKTGFTNGDFDYNGVINGDDYF